MPSQVKHYHKEGRALRTETVINDAYFGIGKGLGNRPAAARRASAGDTAAPSAGAEHHSPSVPGE
jgi:hypothetical protein